MPRDSVDSVVTDPPYHLTSIVKRFGPDDAVPAKDRDGAYRRAGAGFMGKAWDGGDIAFRIETWQAVLRVLKPGGYLLAFASTRGFGRMSVAIEDAGFITHPLIAWVFGSGFPKATRIKADDYDGFRYGGQALKPAIEPIYMGQKPFSEANGTANILLHGTGALNIDGCRIHGEDAKAYEYTVKRTAPGATQNATGRTKFDDGTTFTGRTQDGRWPANLIHDGSDEVLGAFPYSEGNSGGIIRDAGSDSVARGKFAATERGGYGGDGGGSAARFFYTAKADADDRIGSKHPTVKPLDLIQYLCRLVTPPGGTVLDPFAGTGTTGEAAWREGFRAILIEREAEYQADIARRMDLATKPAKRAAVAKTKNNLLGAEGTPLFGGEAAE
ncbi:MAG: site-specific DNA-methyltransferase [Mesorhizobium sp.]|nr:MAG: site-specific DNA-methyltransferase [Mesorhizobium sp.]